MRDPRTDPRPGDVLRDGPGYFYVVCDVSQGGFVTYVRIRVGAERNLVKFVDKMTTYSTTVMLADVIHTEDSDNG